MGIIRRQGSETRGKIDREPEPRLTPAYTKARLFLDALPESSGRRGIKRLAREAGVSHMTMWKAMRQRDGGVREPLAQGPPQRTPEPAQSWQRLRLRIEQDLLQGHLPRDPALPQIRELCARYGVGYRTMRKALAELSTQGVLRSVGHGYHAAVSAANAGSLKIGVLMFAWYEGPLMLTAEYDQGFMVALDLECSRRRISTEVLRYHYHDDPVTGEELATVTDAERITSQKLQSRKDIDGYVLLISNLGSINADLLLQVHATGKPIVIIDELGGWEVPDHLLRGGHMLLIHARPFETASRYVARTLIGRGHSHFAFLSVFHNDVTSQQCLLGFKDTIEIAGAGHSCREFLFRGTQTTDEFTRSGRARCSDAPLQEAYGRWKRSAPRAFVKQLDQFYSHRLGQEIWFGEVRHRLWALFDEAIADKSITCWAVPDCDAGFVAHEYLAERNRRISLVAFGDSLGLLNCRVTTYDFNATAAVNASLDYLVSPTRRLPGQKGITLQIEGVLSVRESLRRV